MLARAALSGRAAAPAAATMAPRALAAMTPRFASHGHKQAPQTSTPWTSHQIRVTRLYRGALKCLMNWTVHRELFISEGFALRAEFDANKSLESHMHIEKLIADGEAKLKEMEHPDPYTCPHDHGGTKYMRYPNNGHGIPKEICDIPPYYQ